MIKAIVFDCFGVLVGSGFYDVYDAAGGDSRKDHDFIEDMLHRASSGTISEVEFSKLMSEKLGITVEQYRGVIRREEQPNKPLFDYITTDLKLRYKIGLISNANVGVINRKIPAEQRALFDEIIVSAEVGLLKPDPKIFALAAQKLGISFGEMIFVDDLEKFVTPAKDLGIHAIQYTDFMNFRQRLKVIIDKTE